MRANANLILIIGFVTTVFGLFDEMEGPGPSEL